MLHSNDENSMSDNSGKWITLVSERTDFTVHQMIVWRRVGDLRKKGIYIFLF